MLADLIHMDHGLIDDQVPSSTPTVGHEIVEGKVQIDLQNYIQNYHGYIHYQRLLFISERCPSLRYSALRRAHDYIKQNTLDTTTYNKLFLMLAEERVGTSASIVASGETPNVTSSRESNGQVLSESFLLPNSGEIGSSGAPMTDAMKQALAVVMSGNNPAMLTYDTQWEEMTRRKSAVLLDQLDTELKNFKANSIKESIRRGSDDLGDLYLNCGQLGNARKCYSRSRDYCTSQQQEITMCLNVIKVALFQRAWSQVSAHVTRAFSLSDMQDISPPVPSSVNTTPTFRSPGTGITSRSEASSSGRAQGTDAGGRTGAISSSESLPRSLVRQLSDTCSASMAPTNASGQNYRDTMLCAHARISIASGLVKLAARNFRAAALSFLQASPDHCESPTSSTVTQSDLAYFITLCTLATFDRSELASQVLSSPHVRLLLEAEPTCRELLYAFHQANYSACLSRLSQIADVLRLDIFLSDHVTILCNEIRNRALCQYFSPYSSVDLNKMALAFDTSVSDLEDRLALLIQQGLIKARIDSHKQLLRVLDVDQRCLTFARALRLIDDYKRHTHAMLLRMSLLRQKVVCQAARDESDSVLSFLP